MSASSRMPYVIFGIAAGTSTAVVALSHFDDKVRGVETVFLGLGIFALTLIPLLIFFPEPASRRKRSADGGA